jgi:hypothetical protein
MSIAGVTNSNFFDPILTQSVQTKFQQIQSQFQQLGQDLQSGNLSQAQQDYATLSQELPGAQQQQTGNSTLAQAFTTLGQDLQSGNLSAAQKDFATLQSDAQQQQQSGQVHYHHHLRGGGAQGSDSTQQNNPISQAFGQLGQALQSGNLASAQTAYASLQQDLQQYLPDLGSTFSSGTVSTASATSGGGVSVTA